MENVETYCKDGIWQTGWVHSVVPFSTGGTREHQVAKGATVARWYEVDHIVRNPDGTVAEHVSYRPAHAAQHASDQH